MYKVLYKVLGLRGYFLGFLREKGWRLLGLVNLLRVFR